MYFSDQHETKLVANGFFCLFNFTVKAETFLKRLYLFIERRKGREKVRERNTDYEKYIDWLPPSCGPGMCPDWELNW